jgi:hypothetical protein
MPMGLYLGYIVMRLFIEVGDVMVLLDMGVHSHLLTFIQCRNIYGCCQLFDYKLELAWV